MRLSAPPRAAWLAAVVAISLATSACSTTSGFTRVRTQGYELSDDALMQIRPGQSQELVTVVLGSPQTTSTFGGETAWYYVETKVEQTAFGLNTVKDRKVLAIYFDNNKRVKDKALYGLQDGRAVEFESRRTPSFGEDRTFIESIIQSL